MAWLAWPSNVLLQAALIITKQSASKPFADLGHGNGAPKTPLGHIYLNLKAMVSAQDQAVKRYL
jgi:hypothetical protein